MNRRSSLRGVTAIAVAPTLWGSARAADMPTLHLAASPTDGSALYFYADAMGFFKKAGFDVQVKAMANGESITAGVIGGSIDVGTGQAISLITAYSRGIPVTIIAGSTINTAKIAPGASGAFFVPKSSAATSGKDFNGKTIAVQGLSGFGQYGTMAWLDRTGGESSTVHFIEMPSSVMGSALAENRVDGAFVPEPNVFNATKVAKKIALPMDGLAPSFYAGAHFATLAWAKAHVDVVSRFENVMYETGAWANKNHDETAEILANAIRLDPEAVRHSVRAQYCTHRDPALLQPMIDLTAKYAGVAPFPAAALFFKD